MPHRDWALAVGLAGVTIATRWPYRARLLPTWDAVQFALALGEYDVVRHQPHPPGYILFVGAARVVAAVVGDAPTSLAVLAVGASAVAVLLLYRLGWTLYGRTVALLAALGLIVSPLFWAYGVVGLSYTAEAALATAVAHAAWGLGAGRVRTLVGSAVLLGLAGGVRQSILVLLAPLWLGMAIQGFRRRGPILAGLGVLGATVAVWLVPMLWLTGGLGRYLSASLELYESTVRPTTLVGGGWWRNVVGLGEALLLGVGVFLPALAWAARRGWQALGARGPRAVFLGLWIGPAFAVYGLVHLGQLGYLLTVLPACYLVVGRVVADAAGRVLPTARWRRAVASAAVAAALGGHVAFFAAAPAVDVPFPGPEAPWSVRLGAGLRARYRFRLWSHTVGGLREREAVIRGYVGAIQRFSPRETALVTELGNPRSYPWFRHVMYYLPEFPVYHLRLGEARPGYLTSRGLETMAAVGERWVPLPPATRWIVWVVDRWDPCVPAPPGLEARRLPEGRWLYVLRVGAPGVEHVGYRLAPETALARLH
jgi:hypothetical protein